MGICNNCGYTMMFNVGVVCPPYKRLVVHQTREIIASITEETIAKKKGSADFSGGRRVMSRV
jgi:hypothetical protein